MKFPRISGLGILAVLAALTVLFVLERRNRSLAMEARARAEALEREVAALKSGPTAEERRQRFTDLSLACADRAAQKYDLTEDQRKATVEVLLLGWDRIDGLMSRLAALRDRGDVDAITTAMNHEVGDYKAWRLDELTKRVGSDLAQRLTQGELEWFGDFSRFEASRQAR